MNKMAKYVIIHDGDLLYTITSEDPDVQRNLTKFMITLSDKNAGGFYLFWVEDDPEPGREKYTLIAVAKNGRLIS